MGKLVIVANGFRKKDIRLQPWRYIYEIAVHLSEKYHVVILSDGDDVVEQWKNNFTVMQSSALSVRKKKELLTVIQTINPEIIFWSTTTRTIAYSKIFRKISCRMILFITSPMYRWTDLLRSVYAMVPFRESKALWLQRFIPRNIFSKFLNNNRFEKIIVQSEENRDLLERIGVNAEKLHIIPVGVDRHPGKLMPTTSHADKDIHLLYLGALRRIRGFDALLRIMPELLSINDHIKLRILARGANEDRCNMVRDYCKKHMIAENIEVIGGWLSKHDVQQYISQADIVVLPFILVPSDIPIAVLEAMAAGKPVIGSNVDGIPGLIRDRGIVVNPLDRQGFIDAIIKITENEKYRKRLAENAYKFMKEYPTWEKIGPLISEVCDAGD